MRYILEKSNPKNQGLTSGIIYMAFDLKCESMQRLRHDYDLIGTYSFIDDNGSWNISLSCLIIWVAT